MGTVVLVGAGASLAEAPLATPRNQLPPLDGTFFRLCRLADLEGQRSVKRYMQTRYGMDPFKGNHTMEDIFNYVYVDAFTPGAPNVSFTTYSALVRMYQQAIADTTNPLSGNSQRGIGAVLRHLWNQENERDITFVTFNQDLIIEKAIDHLSHTGRYAGMEWDIRECYRMNFTGFLGAGGPFFQAATPGQSIQVLKLHGSLNWVYKVRSEEDPKNYIRRVPTDLHCVTDSLIRKRYRYKEKQRNMPLIPFVVPPIYEKSSQYQEAINAIWKEAEVALSAADRLVIFGYSFPNADFAARRLLRRAFHANDKLGAATIIDPSTTAPQRIGDLLANASIHHHRSVRGYVR